MKNIIVSLLAFAEPHLMLTLNVGAIPVATIVIIAILKIWQVCV